MKKLAKRARNFFFLSSNLASWEAGFEGKDMPDKPGYKLIEFTEGDFHFRQEYSIYGIQVLHFFNSKVISYQGKPIWKMTSSGTYHKETAEFLARALFHNHSRGIFIGGRGPAPHYTNPDHPDELYENVVFLDKFENFLGHDQVRFNIHSPNRGDRVTSEIFSRCEYNGGIIPGSILDK